MINLQNLKSKMNKFNLIRFKLVNITLLLTAGLFTAGVISSPLVSADQYTAKIQALQNQNSQIQSSLVGLEGQASSYQQAVDQLAAQISAIQVQIGQTETQISSIQAQIAANQAKLVAEKATLDQIIKSMYVDGNLNTLEMLATSNNISQFVTKEEYRNIVQNQIQGTLASINATQAQLKTQNQQLDSELANQTAMNNQLSASQAQQQQLLAYNQAQQNQFNAQIQGNNATISKLKSEQAAANASVAKHVSIQASSGFGGLCDLGDGAGNGGYPMSLCNASQDSITDPWGFPNRECTSFANWYFVTVEGQSGFKVTGNAGWWWETSNYPSVTWSDSGVKDGALGIEPSSSFSGLPVTSLHGGYYGHVMVVMAKPGESYGGVTVPSGYVLVASMNEDEEGHFMYNLWPVNYLYYINPQ